MATIFQTTFSNAFSWMKIWISIKISLNFIPKGPINNIQALIQIMAWYKSWLVYWHICASLGINELIPILIFIDILV